VRGASGPRHYRGHVANGRVIGRFEAVLGLVGITALVVTYSLITHWNPLPDAGAWLTKAGSFSDPAPVWKVTVGNQPAGGGEASDAVVVGTRGSVEAYRLGSGELIWKKDTEWSALAGGGAEVIVARGGKAHGYDAVSPDSGQQLWGIPDAIGVWTFTDLVVDLTCPGSLSCVVTGRNPLTGAERWRAPLTGNGRTLAGANKALSGLRSPSGLVEPQVPAPPLLGFPLNDEIQLVDTSTGKPLPHAYRDTQTTHVVLAGNHVLVTTVLYRDGHCRYTVDGREPLTDKVDWHLDGYDLHTTDGGLGCEQRKDPLGSGSYVVALGPDNREQLLDTGSGRVLYHAGDGEDFADVDGRVALVRSADQKSVKAIDLVTGDQAWSRQAGRSVKVGLGPGVALFVDPGAGQLAALTEQNGNLRLNAKTGATVLGYAGNGLVINVGRSVGLLTYGASTG
jgi:outer membrane protein assembly factor BamB